MEAGAWAYSAHPSTHVLCFAYKLDGVTRSVIVDQNDPHTAFEVLAMLANDPDVVFTAYNAFFERMIWRHILTERFGVPEVPVDRWRCTMARALAMAVPKSLNSAGVFLDTKQKKDAQGTALMLKLCKLPPEQINTTQLERLAQYCEQDVETEDAINEKTVPLTAEEQLVWELDQEINERGVLLDTPSVQQLITVTDLFTQDLNTKIVLLTGGDVTAITQIARIKTYVLKKYGINIESLNKASIVRYLNDPVIDDDLKELIRLRAAGGKSSLAKLTKMIQHGQIDNYARGNLIYHGASTGRWTSGGIQLQNIAKGDKIDHKAVFEDLKNLPPADFVQKYGMKTASIGSSLLRGMIIPPPGQRLFVADYASIEARIVLWLAGSKAAVQRIVDFDNKIGDDMYVVMARTIFDDLTITKADNDKRQLGKAATLGCGFGMGATKFKATCAAPPYNLDIDDTLALKAVESYRNEYPEVPAMWRGLENAAKTAIRTGFGKWGCIGYHLNGKWLSCKLPSGRLLWYYDPKIERGQYGDTITFLSVDSAGNFAREKTWGGTLTENVVQATARDIMVFGMQNLERHGYQVVLTVHDEVLTYIDNPALTPDRMADIMRLKPAWAKGCPINVEAKEMARYGK